ncbi:MAG: Hint domain-containing protein [Pseudomonadota bacterium]
MSWTAIWNSDGEVYARAEAPSGMKAATLLLEGRATADLSKNRMVWAGLGENAVALRQLENGAIDLRHRDAHLRTDPGILEPNETYRLVYRSSADGTAGLEVRSLDRPGLFAVCHGSAAASRLVEDYVPAQPVMSAFGCLGALANQEAPIHDGIGLERGTQVMTQAGLLPVEDLRTGDIVMIDDGAPAVVQSCESDEAVTLGSMNAVRFCAPYFGLQRDVVVARHTPIQLRGASVDYLCGSETVAASAGDLVDNQSILRDLSAPLRDFVSVRLDRPGALCVGHARIFSAAVNTDSVAIDRGAAQSLLAMEQDLRGLIG